MIKESRQPSRIIDINQHAIKCYDDLGNNIDLKTVQSFGEEWMAFNQFSDDEIERIGHTYFDIVRPEMIGKEKIAVDFGCGTGRWSKYFHRKIGAIAAIDPSDAIFAASQLLKDIPNVQLYKASIDNLPFADDYFDFGFSLGVLHHIPDTQKAMDACIKKIKPGGHFLAYLYYDLDNRGFVYKSLFAFSNLIRRVVSRMPGGLKKVVCKFLAIVFYMPFILLIRFFRFLGIPKKVRSRMPLYSYEKASFYVISNDALDRFGTSLEQRFTKKEIAMMMQNSGLQNIIFSDHAPFWHAIGQKE